MIHPRPFSFLLLSKRRTRLTKDKCGYAEVRRFRTNDEWNFIRMNFSFSPSIAERPHTAKEQSNQENQFIENTQRVRERFARNFPSAPPSRQTFEYIARVSQIRYIFSVLYLESRNQLHALSTVEILNNGQPTNCHKLEGVTRAIK